MSDLKDRMRNHFVKTAIKAVVTCPECGKAFGVALTKEELYAKTCDVECPNRDCPDGKKPKEIHHVISGWDE